MSLIITPIIAKLARPCTPCYSLTQVRFRRQEKYGHEEGHGYKDEFKNEKSLWKKRIRTTGQVWRSQQGLPDNPFHIHSLASRPDWRFKDGTPGYFTKRQAEAIEVMEDLCQDVQKAIKLLNVDVKKGKPSYP